MPAPPPPLPLSSAFGPYGAFVEPMRYQPPSLEPGDRVGGPPPARRRRLVRRMAVASAAAIALWLAFERREDVTALTALATAVFEGMQPPRQVPGAPARDVAASIPEPTMLPERVVPPAPVMQDDGEEAAETPREASAGQPPHATPDAQDAQPSQPATRERLPAIATDPADPLQQKALAAGLHPELSRTLLHQLTPEDYRNAAHAVNTLLAAKKPTSPVIWPRQKTAQQAQFKVRIVDGAPTECRRYVVQIAKAGWETTARPMERCKGADQAFKPS